MVFQAEHDVRATGTGASALEILGSWPPEILISDLAMPGVQGEEVAQAAAALPSPPHIVLMSAERTRLDTARPLADAVFRKPFELDELTSLVARFHQRSTGRLSQEKA